MRLRRPKYALLCLWMVLAVGPAVGEETKGLVLGPQDGEKLIRRWGYPFLMKVDEVNGGAEQFVVGAERIPPGKAIHVHRHGYAEELLIINSGNGTALLGDKKVPVGPGTLVFIPQHTWAGLTNTGNDDIDLLWIFPKPGIDKYFRATSVPDGQKPSPLSKEELDRIRTQYNDYVMYHDENLSNYVEGSSTK